MEKLKLDRQIYERNTIPFDFTIYEQKINLFYVYVVMSKIR